MPNFVLSPQAQKSLKQIRSYILENFGKQETILYLNALRERMQHLAKHPSDGKTRDEIKAGNSSYFVGKHTIYYRIRITQIEIIDVLHQSMEPNEHS
jgi:toxin ParE1/3/4